MEIVAAAVHVAGAVLTLVLLSFVFGMVVVWQKDLAIHQVREEAAARLRISVDELSNTENTGRWLEFYAERFSSDQWRNRISDALGVVRFVWRWLGSLLVLVAFGGVIWLIVIGKPRLAVYIWWTVPLFACFELTSLMLSMLCRLATGRYPGEARSARRAAAPF